MNWKQIIRAAFDLTNEEWDQVVRLRALSEPERELLTAALGPQKPAAKKSSKKAGKKSARAQSLGEQLKQRPRGVVTGDDEEGPFCNICHHNEGYQDHFKPSPNYHKFEPGKSAASPAPPPSDQASSEIGKGAASHVAGGSNG